MTAYYNEIDPFAAAWLRELIAAGHIAPGVVDERSIQDVIPSDLTGFTQHHFFAGIGVWSYALRLAGWPDDRPIWTGSCPCQPFSAAGKGGGFDDERHLWPAFHWLIDQLHPVIIVGEQVASRDGLAWLDLVSTDLENTGYAVGTVDLCAAGVGAPHLRQRSYWLADNNNDGRAFIEEQRRESVQSEQQAPRRNDTDGRGPSDRPGPTNGAWRDADWLGCTDGRWRPVESGSFPLVNGLAGRVGRLRGYGNAIVAPVAAEFIKAVMACV